MKKFLFSVLAILLVATGCMPFILKPTSKPDNQPPTAYIDSISPAEVTLGQTVIFKGHGTDVDGTVAAYRWRSGTQGELSTSESFETSSLSEGTHTIWFRVQDDKGNWSSEVSAHVVVQPNVIVQPVIDSFLATPGSIVKGQSSTLSWSVRGAARVVIDPEIGNVAPTGTRIVSPANTAIYTLKATNENGAVSVTAQIAVSQVSLRTVELFSIVEESGQVRDDGYVGREPNVGKTASNAQMQAFLSFDISMIPAGAIIKSATLDFSSAEIMGSPSGALGKLSVFSRQYGVLKSSDFMIGPALGGIYVSFVKPIQPISFDVLVSAIQTQVDARSPRFQIGLKFDKTFYSQDAHYIALGEGRTKLVIQYQD